jgi:hypothetical protein
MTRATARPRLKLETAGGFLALGCQCRPEIGLILAVAAVVIILSPLHCDAAWYMVAARRVLQGDRLYADLLDTNPPLIVWLTTIPAFLSRLLDVSDRTLMHSFTALLLVVSGLLANRILGLAPAAPRALAFVLITAFAMALSVPWIEWMAQREQITAVLIFPYVLVAARAARRTDTPRWLAFVSGVLAGIAVGLKPFFLAPWLAVEFTVCVLRREVVAIKRPEVVLVVLIQGVYALLVITVTPEYFSEVVPLARATYGAYGTSWEAVAVSRKVAAVLAIALGGLLAPSVLGVRRGYLSEILGALTLGFLVSYVAQSKGWYYHFLPAFVFATCTIAAVTEAIVAASHKIREPRVAMSGARIAVAALVLSVWVAPHGYRFAKHDMFLLRSGQYPGETALVQIASEVAPGEPIYFLSTAIRPAFPVVNYASTRWPYRYPFLWPLPGFYPGRPGERPVYRRPAEQSDLERRFFEAVVADVSATPPRLLFVERGRNHQAMQGREFDFVEYFSGSRAFTELFARYGHLGRVADWDVYELR